MATRRRSSFDDFPTAEPTRRSSTPHVQGDAYRPVGGAHEAYSRRTTQAEYSRMRSKKKRRKTIITALVAVLAVLVVGVGAAFAYVNILNGKLGAGVDDALINVLDSSKVEAGDPFYILLMGVDRSQEREGSAEYAGDTYRSDSMILARIDPQQKKMTLISIVRDTYVDITDRSTNPPTDYGYNKINAAHALGGPALTVQTVSEFAGVPISHYAEIDFDGFKAAVDALGGIEVDVPVTIDDELAGGYVEAGPQTLNGDQALILCRSRHSYDDMGDGDVYRAANQRLVMGAVAKKLLASDPATIASTVASLCDYITTDMDVSEIVNVALAMKGMDTATDIYSCMNPTVSAYENDLWIEYSNNEAWRAMMQRVDQGLPPTVNAEDSANNGGVKDGSLDKEYIAQSALRDSGGSGSSSSSASVTGSIAVQNGSGVSRAASTASSQLINKGYDVSSTGDADSYSYSNTLVIYNDDSQEQAARAIAESLGVGIPVKNDGSYAFDGSFLVIIGKDY